MIIRYLGDRLISTSSSDSLPNDVLEGAELYSIPLKVRYSYYNNTWNPVESGVFGLTVGTLGQTIYHDGNQWSGNYNIFNNNDLIGFGTRVPLNKGHFYAGSGIVAGWATGIILENQSDTGAVSDWGDLTVMSSSGDWGDLTAMDSSGDWGSILDSLTPGVSIDVKLSQDRRTVSALRFKRLVSGTSNYDSNIEFWVTDGGTLLPKFTIQSGQFLPWLSGRNFLGAPELPFSGVHSNKFIGTQLQLEDGVIPNTGNILSSNSGYLYWSGYKALTFTGGSPENNSLVKFNKSYSIAEITTGIFISGTVSGDRMGFGITTPEATLDVVAHSNAPAIIVGSSSINLSSKHGIIATKAHTHSNFPTAMISVSNTSSQSTLSIGGGGLGGMTNATRFLRFFTSETHTGAGGTQRLQIDPNGHITAGNFVVRNSGEIIGINEISPPNISLYSRGINYSDLSQSDFNEPNEWQSNCALSDWFAFDSVTGRLVAPQPATKIVKINSIGGELTLMENNNMPSGTMAFIKQGDIIRSYGKPIYAYATGFPHALVPVSVVGNQFGFFTNRNQPHWVKFYSPFGPATIDYYYNQTNTGTITYTLNLQITGSGVMNGVTGIINEGTHRFYSTAPVLAVHTGLSGSDSCILFPASREILFSNQTIDGSGLMGTGESVDIVTNNQYLRSRYTPLFATSVDDNGGTGSEGGLPYKLCGNNYTIGHNLAGYSITAIEPTTIKVACYSGGAWTDYATHNLTTASRHLSEFASAGNQGTGINLATSIGVGVDIWQFQGNKPFLLRTNDPVSKEYIVLGHRTTLTNSAGKNGSSGSSGTAGTAGTSGNTGDQGNPGDNGTSGTSGVNGAAGSSGTSGTSGVNGAAGSSGTSGTSGVNGAAGSSGTSGTSGATSTATNSIVVGAGTAYSLTTSLTLINFGTTDPSITLPSAGTYLVMAKAQFLSGATANDQYKILLYDATNTPVLPGSYVDDSNNDANQYFQLTTYSIYTVAGSASIELQASNSTANRGQVIDGGATSISYIKLS